MLTDDVCYSLAQINMRLILARLLYKFDLELADEAQDWIGEQKIFTVWEKIPLMVHVKAASGY